VFPYEHLYNSEWLPRQSCLSLQTQKKCECKIRKRNYVLFFYVFLNVHHSIDFSKYQLNAQFFYSSTIYMLHYVTQHVSSSVLLETCWGT